MENKPSVFSYIASWLTVFLGGLTLEKFAVLVGIATALATFFINWYYRAKADARGERNAE